MTRDELFEANACAFVRVIGQAPFCIELEQAPSGDWLLYARAKKDGKPITQVIASSAPKELTDYEAAIHAEQAKLGAPISQS